MHGVGDVGDEEAHDPEGPAGGASTVVLETPLLVAKKRAPASGREKGRCCKQALDEKKNTCLSGQSVRALRQLDCLFLGAVAQLVEHLLCKKNASNAVLDL